MAKRFFHTFDALYEQQKQIVISSDCLPKDIKQQRGQQLNLFGGAGSAPKPKDALREKQQEYAHKVLMQHFAEDRNEFIRLDDWFGKPKHR